VLSGLGIEERNLLINIVQLNMYDEIDKGYRIWFSD
jgi:hypothetical protein